MGRPSQDLLKLGKSAALKLTAMEGEVALDTARKGLWWGWPHMARGQPQG